MGSPSAPLHRRCIPWQKLLLTASLLTFWNPPTTAQLTIESRPFNVAEGKEVLLLAHNLPHNLFGYIWYKGERVDASRRIGSYVIGIQQITLGPAHSGRETIYFNASLLIQNVTQNDTGSITLQAIKEDLVNEEATGRFRVYRELSNTTYLWCVNQSGASRSDPPGWSCPGQQDLTVFNMSVRRSDPVTLNVLYGPDAPTISPLNTPYRAGENLNLTCHAASNPTAQYSWFVNGTFQQSTQELFIPNITVNNSGSYMCQAHNSATGLNRTTVTAITVYGKWIHEQGSPLGKGETAQTLLPALLWAPPRDWPCLTPPGVGPACVEKEPGCQSTPKPPVVPVRLQENGKKGSLRESKVPHRAIFSVIYTVELPKPYITSNNSNPIEDKDAVTLTCEPVTENTTYLWWVNNQSLSVSPRLQLSNGNRILTLLSVTRNDTGPYECGIQNSESAKRSDPVTLNVTYGPDTPIISPPDLSYRSGANLNLSCHSDSNPSPQYSWLINGTLRQHTQVLFISKITSNNNGAYACFVSNLATGRNNSIVKNISVSSGNSGLSARATVSIIMGILVGVALM
uniref:Ig-like domain-containing protein n=1 Tax=Cercocebus atys TaxID=9531 RepID=A0A2K5MLC5_CERAT